MAVRKRKKKKGPPVNKEDQQLLQALCTALLEFNIETRIEKGRFRGGTCLVEGDKRILFVNKRHTLDRQIALVLSEFRKIMPEDTRLPLPDDVREKLNRYR